MRLKKFVLPCVLLVASGLTVSAQAVPWCYGGTIVTVQTHNLDEGTLLFLFGSQTIPSGVDPLQEDRYIASTVGWDLAYAHAGGGGGWNGWSVPNAGEVRVDAFFPASYLSGLTYHLSEGLRFHVEKCYTIPPHVQIDWEVEVSEKPGAGGYTVFPYLKNIERYWEPVPVSPTKPR